MVGAKSWSHPHRLWPCVPCLMGRAGAASSSNVRKPCQKAKAQPCIRPVSSASTADVMAVSKSHVVTLNLPSIAGGGLSCIMPRYDPAEELAFHSAFWASPSGRPGRHPRAGLKWAGNAQTGGVDIPAVIHHLTKHGETKKQFSLTPAALSGRAKSKFLSLSFHSTSN